MEAGPEVDLVFNIGSPAERTGADGRKEHMVASGVLERNAGEKAAPRRRWRGAGARGATRGRLPDESPASERRPRSPAKFPYTCPQQKGGGA